jgi:hypothetical protein
MGTFFIPQRAKKRVQVTKPVCVIVFRDPVENARSLLGNKKSHRDPHSGTLAMVGHRWVATWHEGAMGCLIGAL